MLTCQEFVPAELLLAVYAKVKVPMPVPEDAPEEMRVLLGNRLLLEVELPLQIGIDRPAPALDAARVARKDEEDDERDEADHGHQQQCPSQPLQDERDHGSLRLAAPGLQCK